MNSPAGLPCVSSSSPRPEETRQNSASVVDEIMGMAVAWANARETPGQHAAAMARFDALVARLSSLVSELEGYRKERGS